MPNESAFTVGRRKLKNMLVIEQDWKLLQLARVVGFSLTFVAISTTLLAYFGAYLIHLGMDSGPSRFDVGSALEIMSTSGGLQLAVSAWATAMTSISLLYSMVVGVHMGHRLAGPIYRIKTDLGQIAQDGEYRTIALRKNDDFREVVASINAAFVAVEARGGSDWDGDAERKQLQALREGRDEASRIIEGVDRSALSSEDAERLGEALKALTGD